MTPMERFAAKVEVGVCMEWTGSLDKGYGRFRADGRHWRAHRWLWTQVYGPIPTSLQLDHLCRNRRCVDPLHLRAVSQRTNLFAGHTIPAINAAKTHCDHGHEFTTENTYRRPSTPNRRECRTCQRGRWIGAA